jgi:glycerol-3-phosphate cytidylyltransferase
MKIVITYGTFDLFHIGHWNLLRRAKSQGDYLIVAISTDEFNSRKGKTSSMNFLKRKEVIQSLSFVDKVIAENDWNQKISDIKQYDIDVFIMGNDWINKFNFLKKYCKVLYLKRTKGISTTLIKSFNSQPPLK